MRTAHNERAHTNIPFFVSFVLVRVLVSGIQFFRIVRMRSWVGIGINI